MGKAYQTHDEETKGALHTHHLQGREVPLLEERLLKDHLGGTDHLTAQDQQDT